MPLLTKVLASCSCTCVVGRRLGFGSWPVVDELLVTAAVHKVPVLLLFPGPGAWRLSPRWSAMGVCARVLDVQHRALGIGAEHAARQRGVLLGRPCTLQTASSRPDRVPLAIAPCSFLHMCVAVSTHRLD